MWGRRGRRNRGARDPGAIHRIQLDSLVGLELQLISRTVTVAPRALVALGRACLSDSPTWDPPA
jgi:hypothetical protein